MISNRTILLRLCLATLTGTILGVQRERSNKPAGTRTHILVCLSACIIAIVSAYGFDGLGTDRDPARLVVGILSGIGFLGAGIIWRSASGGVQGITTAAEIFLLSALGISCSCGLGLYFLTCVSTMITLLTLSFDNLLAHIRKRFGL